MFTGLLFVCLSQLFIINSRLLYEMASTLHSPNVFSDKEIDNLLLDDSLYDLFSVNNDDDDSSMRI